VVRLGALARHGHADGPDVILGLLAAWALAGEGGVPAPGDAPVDAAPVDAAVAALAERPLDPRAQLALAAALSGAGRHQEAAGIREAWLGASDPSVLMDARVALARWLLAEAPRPALEALLVDVLRGSDLHETPALQARLTEVRALAETRTAETRTTGEADRATVGAGVRAALDAGDVAAAVASTQAAVAIAPTPDARALLLDDLASVLVVSAEARKRAGDIAGAIEDYVVAVALRPDAAPRVRGLAGLLWQSGHLEGAWALYQRAFDLDRDDPATLSAALAVGVAAGHEDEAWALVVLAGPPGPEVEALRRAFERFRGIRDADAAASVGDLTAAEARFRALVETWPEDARIRRGLADALVGLGRLEEARVAWREAARREPLDPWAVLGEANVLVKLGRPAEGRARLAEAFPPDAPEAAVAERRRVEGRAWQIEAEQARAAGDAPGAADAYRAALGSEPDPWVYVGVAFLYLEDGQPERALAFCDAALALAPDHAGAAEARVHALAALGRHDEALAALAARTVSPGERANAERLRATLLVDAALAHARAAEGRPREAARRYEAVLRDAPDHVGALLGLTGAWIASGRLRLAADRLQAELDRLGDPRLGLALVDVQTRRGAPAAAAAALARVEATAAPAPPPPVGGRLAALPLPSGDALPPAPPPPPAAESHEAGVRRARDALAAERAPRASAGVLAIARGGLPGTSQIAAIGLPVEATSGPLGPVRARVQVVPLHLLGDTGTDDGVAATVGVLTPEARRVSGSVHVGTSPLGFDGGVYPTWSARLALRLVPKLGLAIETTRAPRSDSRASWASEVYAPTGQRYGRASELSIGASLSWSTPTTNLGVSGRTGWVEGIGVRPNGLGEGVFWVEQHVGADPVGVSFSTSGVAQAYARRDDGFLPGEGAYFSPPLHLAGLARLDGHVRVGPARFCAGVGGGPRWLGGEATAFASAGVGAVATARIGAGVRLSRRLSLAVDGRGQLVSDGWRQVGALALLSWGVPAVPGDLRSSATLAAAGLALPAAGDVCPVP
jgi:tetratricopeptide (TPR) repeat protein